MYYVYLITEKNNSKKNKPVKIGYSNDPDKRLATLQTGNPRELIVAVAIAFDTELMAREAERALHELAERKYRRLVGEWFSIKGSWPRFISDGLKMFDGSQKVKGNIGCGYTVEEEWELQHLNDIGLFH